MSSKIGSPMSAAPSPGPQPHQRTAWGPFGDTGRMIAALRKGWWLIPVVIVAALVIAAVLTSGQSPLYRSSTTMIVVPAPETRDTGDILKSLETLERRTVVATFARIPSAPETRDAAGRRLAIGEEALKRYRIEGGVVPNTNIIRIDAEGPDPDVAARLANAAAAVTNAQARALYRIYTMQVLARANPESRPVQPDVRRNYLVALVLGVLAGIVAAIAWPEVMARVRRAR